jgi:uncharacterized protein (TIGR02266 family)
VAPGTDKRKTGTRAHVELDVDLGTYGRYFLSKLENISTGGAFIRTRQLHPVGTSVRVRFRLPGDEEPIESEGKVIWIYEQPGDEEPNSSGMGVQFTQMEEENRDRIADFVASITGKRTQTIPNE